MKQLNDQYFTYRQTPVDYDGVARPSIKGNTLVWNQLLVPQSSGYFTSNRCTTVYTNGNSVSTATGQTTNYSFGIFRKTGSGGLRPIANHKYFISAEVTINFTGRVRIGFDSGDVYAPVEKDKKTRLYFVKSTESSTNTFLCYATKDGSYLTSSDTLSIDNWWICDLTQAYGEGNEPTADKFVSLFSLPMYAYNSGSLLNFNGTGIKTTGRNLFDGTIYSNNHGINSNGVIYSTTDYKVYTVTLPVGDYVISATNVSASPSQALRIMNVDSSLTKLTLDGDTIPLDTRKSFTFSVPSGTAQTLISIYNNHKDVQLEFGSSATSYEPYTTSTTSLPISTYFTNGMKSVGSVYDELSDKAITRVGSVDLGSLTWVTTSDENRFTSTGTKNIAKPAPTNTEVANMISTVNVTSYTSLVDKSAEGVALNSNTANLGMICIRDTSVSSVQELVAKYTGVYLNYELITYTEQDVDPIYYDFYGNGTEQLIPVNTDTPTTSPLLADIIYYNLTDSEVPYRVFWAINSKGERWDFTEREFKSFMNNPQGLGFSKTISVNRYGNVQNLTDITDNFPQPNGEVLFYDSHNSTRYDKYNQFVKFLSYEPITLYYKIPVSFFSRIPNTYSLECVVGTLTKAESKTDHMLTCSINYNALSFYKGEEVEISGTGTSYTINNDSDFPIGFEIQIDGTSMVNPYIQLSQNGNLYGEAKFVGKMNGTNPNVPFSKVYVNSKDGEQNVILEQGGSVLPNPMSYQDLSISNGSIYVTFVKLARGESTLTLGKDSGTFSGVTIRYTPIYRSV